ncbi:ATP-binding response regulator [Terracidiphilus gabretensis]|uniref:ATP-binding response regulator n=1 Tax=Terracidiphilus gabretensis TaxID=1577687 RepID=UPI00071B05D7|nr:ATP-binding protein [Terracidiphilus gabretensis]
MTWDQKVNILMVDDQPAKLLSYEVILEQLDANLIKATTASQALNILLKNDIAVVLMDVSMPDVDGFELADVIRKHPRFQKTAIIFVSGVHLADSDKIQGYRSGAVDYIAVPVIPEVLRAKVSIFAELHRKTRMLEKLNLDLERRVEERTRELREREAAFRTRSELLDLATEAIIVRDLTGAIQLWSVGAENLYGWSREEAIGRDLHALLHTIFPTSREEVAATLEMQSSWQGNLLQKTKSGFEIIVACRKTVNQESNAILEVGRDITAQLRAEEALRETEKLAAMGRVAGIIAHEINNPLAAITNIFYLLQNHASLNDEARHFASLADQELRRVSHITRQTLSFYRESKQPVSVSIGMLLDEVVELQDTRIHSSNIVLEKRYSDSSSVYGFPFELRQVFMNLIANAIQAMPNGGILRLSVQDTIDSVTRKHGVSISIIDTGKGIQPEHKSRLFEPFFTTKSTKGTGLGLWISKGIIQKYNGRIVCRSYFHTAGCATSFRIFIPAEGVLDAPTTSGGGGLRIEHNPISDDRSSSREFSKIPAPTWPAA